MKGTEMTYRQEQKARAKFFDSTTTLYAYGVLASVFLFAVLLKPLILVLGIGTCLMLFLGTNTIYTGGKLMRNPFEQIRETKEKQDALIDHLELEATLVPRHWMFKSKKKRTSK